jgi:hypothetical protein
MSKARFAQSCNSYKQLWAGFLAHQALLFLLAFGFEVSRGWLIGAILPDELLLGSGQHS